MEDSCEKKLELAFFSILLSSLFSRKNASAQKISSISKIIMALVQQLVVDNYFKVSW